MNILRARRTGYHHKEHLHIIRVLVDCAIGPQEIRNIQIKILCRGGTSSGTNINTRTNRASNGIQRSPWGSFGIVPMVRYHHTYFHTPSSTRGFRDQGTKGQFQTKGIHTRREQGTLRRWGRIPNPRRPSATIQYNKQTKKQHKIKRKKQRKKSVSGEINK